MFRFVAQGPQACCRWVCSNRGAGRKHISLPGEIDRNLKLEWFVDKGFDWPSLTIWRFQTLGNIAIPTAGGYLTWLMAPEQADEMHAKWVHQQVGHETSKYQVDFTFPTHICMHLMSYAMFLFSQLQCFVAHQHWITHGIVRSRWLIWSSSMMWARRTLLPSPKW